MTPDRLLITRDFNIHVDKPEDPAAAKFLSLLQSFGIVQHVTVPTHVAGHTPDLVITREDCDLLTCSPMAHYMMSSHSTVLFPLSMAKPKRPTIVRTCRKIKSIDMDRFRSDIESSLLLSSPAENMDKFAEQYQETLSRILENHAPKVTIRVRQRALKPWYSSDIAKAKLDRRRLERRWRRSKLEVDRQLFVEARNNVSRLLLDAKTSFYSARIHELNGNQKALFREMNHLLHKSTETPLPPHDSPEVLANQFAEYFSEKIEKIRLELQCCIVQPSTTSSTQSSSVRNICELSSFDNVPIKTVSDLIASAPSKTCALDPIPTRLLKQCTDLLAPTITSMVNLSLSTGTVPNEWKDAIVLPTLKRKQDILTKENYRPISNFPFVSKICEKTVAVQFSNHLRENCLIEPFQSGYRANHSTETALLRVFNDILRSIDQRKVTILVLLDLSAAFDTVDHNILLQRLHTRFGISGTALDWFKDYLANRRQRVSVNGSLSDPVQVKCGVPQGSVLGPLLFLAYISPLGDIIRRHGLDFHMYADDTQLYLAFDFEKSQMALATIRAAICDINDWLLLNMLKFNNGKTDLCVIGSHQQLSKLNLPLAIHVEQSEMVTDESITNLRVIMDQHLKLDGHVNKVIKVCMFHLRTISKIRRFLTIEACKLLIHALVTSRLDYCNSILYGCNQSVLQRLQLLQNYAARLVYKIPKFCHITPYLKDLHWLPVQARIQFKLLTIVFKCLHGNGPQYLSELLCRKMTRSGLRSANSIILYIPRTLSRAEQSTADRSFSMSGPKLWNQLPVSIQNSCSLDVFKSRLKTFLFKKFFY